MPPLIQDTLTWAWAYVQHVVIMFYWAWVPGFLAAALLSARYRPALAAITLRERAGPRAFWAAIGWGMTSGAGRRTSLETARTLWRQGLPDHTVLAYLVASHILGLYSLVLFTILIGLEFALGVFLGGLAMVGLLRLLAPARSSGGGRAPNPTEEVAIPSVGSWRVLVGSARGWGQVVRDVGRYVRNVGLSLIGGLVLGALVLAIDTRGSWVFPQWMGDETLAAALAGSFLAPLLSVVLFLAPGGNLIVVSSILKTWTLAYSGLISFVLMGLLNPLTVRTLLHHYSGTRGWWLVLALYLSAALGGLAVSGLFVVLGVQVTHVPWFRELVDKLMMMFPFTMWGAPGGGMRGM
ncbi:MAG: permease [Candidatus Rokubacteria bacterium]|nr:permease [Candidatus Rokubacteria bacterium]